MSGVQFFYRHCEAKQAENDPSRRPAQGSNRVKCYNYTREHCFEKFYPTQTRKRFFRNSKHQTTQILNFSKGIF